MDWQALFYTLGTIFFVVSFVIILLVLALVLWIYSKVRRAKKKIKSFKEAIPLISFVIKKWEKIKKQ